MRNRLRWLALFGTMATVIVASLVPVLGSPQVRRKAPEQVEGSRMAPPFRQEALNWKPTRTPWGDPDLQGEWTGMTPTPLERPVEGRGRITDPVELARLWDAAPDSEPGAPRGVGTYNAGWSEWGREISYHPAFRGRTEWIIDPPDGRLPAMTPEARKRAEARAARRGLDGSVAANTPNPEDRGVKERCVSFDLVISGTQSTWWRIVQSPGWVALQQYRMHDMRMIPLDGRPHLPQDVRSWMGDSRGRFEGQTLVVETTNFNGKNSQHGSSANMRLTERFTRIDADTIKYEATIDDPTVWTKPWTVSIPLAKDNDGFFEYACHEGNASMTGSLSGARAAEKAAAGKIER